MKQKEIKQLAEYSFTKNLLDEQKVLEFVAYMDRKTLKTYIAQLKEFEKKRNVIIALPSTKSYNTGKKAFEDMFSDKHIEFVEDPTLLAGLRIQDNDMIYEQSLNNILSTFVEDIERNYE